MRRAIARRGRFLPGLVLLAAAAVSACVGEDEDDPPEPADLGECQHVAFHVLVFCEDAFEMDPCVAQCVEGATSAEVLDAELCTHETDECDVAIACLVDGEICDAG